MQRIRDLLKLRRPTGTVRINKVLDVLVTAVQELDQGVKEVNEEVSQVSQTIMGLEGHRIDLMDSQCRAERICNNIRTLMGE